MITILLGYFFGGVLLDIFYTIWYAGVAEKNIPYAAVGTFLVTMYSYIIFRFLLFNTNFYLVLFIFSLGCAAGTAGTMWYKNRRTKL